MSKVVHFVLEAPFPISRETQEQKLNGLLAVLFRVLLKKFIRSTTNLIIFGKVRKLLRSCENTAKKINYLPKVIKQWLSQQAFWQVHLPAPKHINRPHYQVTIPNEMHQFDLLYMPSDTLYGNKYKYILAGIDAASRYKVDRPLKIKQARNIAEMIAEIYKVGPLTYPKIFQCDNGSKFKGEVTKMLEHHEVKVQ